MSWLSSVNDACHVVTSDEEYYQAVAIEKIPAVMVNGEVTSWRLVAHTLRVRDRVEEWRGLTKTAAFAIGGEETKQAGNEDFSFDYYSVKVSRRRVNEANGWTVTKTTSWRALYSDGVWQYGANQNNFG